MKHVDYEDKISLQDLRFTLFHEFHESFPRSRIITVDNYDLYCREKL